MDTCVSSCFSLKNSQCASLALTTGTTCWRSSKHLHLIVFLVNQFHKHLVFERIVLPVDIHGRFGSGRADFISQLLLDPPFAFLGDQFAVRGHAEIVVLERRRVPERCLLNSHRAPNRGEEPNFLAVDPGRLLRLSVRAAAGNKTSSGSEATGQILMQVRGRNLKPRASSSHHVSAPRYQTQKEGSESQSGFD